LRGRLSIGDAAPTCSMRRDHSDVVVFCFSKPEDAEAFAEGFVGSGCLRVGENPESKPATGPRCFRTNAKCRTSAHPGGPDR
jgi:hypothetical protein